MREALKGAERPKLRSGHPWAADWRQAALFKASEQEPFGGCFANAQAAMRDIARVFSEKQH